MKKLVDYMKQRAAHEGVECALSAAWHFDQGIRTFFGVSVDKDGGLLTDEQQPDFFAKYQQLTRS